MRPLKPRGCHPGSFLMLLESQLVGKMGVVRDRPDPGGRGDRKDVVAVRAGDGGGRYALRRSRGPAATLVAGLRAVLEPAHDCVDGRDPGALDRVAQALPGWHGVALEVLAAGGLAVGRVSKLGHGDLVVVAAVRRHIGVGHGIPNRLILLAIRQVTPLG